MQKLTLRAVVPGRAWLVDGAGNTVSVTTGDVLPYYGKVTKIDSDKGPVGEIQFDLALAGVDGEHLKAAFDNVSSVVRSVAGVDLAFSVDEDIRKMVVTVRAVGSDEIIRQFPPEEFLSVAKFIAAQNPDVLDEDFLKGLLFDQQA